ncbi:MAG TPA: hypothetical protein DCS91_20150 [Microcoleaceae bacterium UBA11344]|nr:hypothetical protein [Microcoleaceae cyanobacterium UBA11344]
MSPSKEIEYPDPRLLKVLRGSNSDTADCRFMKYTRLSINPRRDTKRVPIGVNLSLKALINLVFT